MADNDFWTGLRDTFSGIFGGGSTPNYGSYSGYDPMETTIPQPGGPAAQGGPNSSGSNADYGELFKGLGKTFAPAAAQVGAGALINKFLPSTPTKIVAPDTRTQEGMSAENLRLSNAGTSSEALAKARSGQLDPYMEQQVRKRSRAADAGRGMLETGGSAVRETNAVQEELNRVINREAGNVSSMTSGYSPRAATVMPGHENPWAKILTAAFMPNIEKSAKNPWAI